MMKAITRHFFWILLNLTIISSSAVLTAVAETEKGEKDGFFPKNYAEAPGVQSEGDAAEINENKGNEQDDLFPEVNRDIKQNQGNDGHLRDDTKQGSTREAARTDLNSQPQDLDQGFPLDSVSVEVKNALSSAEYISAIIDCEFQQSCTESLGKIHKVSSETKLPIRFVLVVNLIGTTRGDSAPTIIFGPNIPNSDASTYASKLVFLTSLPESYPVERTPSWIVGTKKGEVILDGWDNPTRLLKSLRSL